MMILRLPYPGKALWPNARPHPMARAHSKIRLREAVASRVLGIDARDIRAVVERRDEGWSARVVDELIGMSSVRLGPPMAAVDLLLVYRVQYRHHAPDPDNCIAAAKAAIDALVVTRVLVDDCAVVYLPPVVEIAPHEERSLCMHVTERSWDPDPFGSRPNRRPSCGAKAPARVRAKGRPQRDPDHHDPEGAGGGGG